MPALLAVHDASVAKQVITPDRRTNVAACSTGVEASVQLPTELPARGSFFLVGGRPNGAGLDSQAP
ncbi:MAG: hypothetical protein AAFV88_20595 [Planctomycetota bacterium]